MTAPRFSDFAFALFTVTLLGASASAFEFGHQAFPLFNADAWDGSDRLGGSLAAGRTPCLTSPPRSRSIGGLLRL
jgi:hypothetical protein